MWAEASTLSDSSSLTFDEVVPVSEKRKNVGKIVKSKPKMAQMDKMALMGKMAQMSKKAKMG